MYACVGRGISENGRGRINIDVSSGCSFVISFVWDLFILKYVSSTFRGFSQFLRKMSCISDLWINDVGILLVLLLLSFSTCFNTQADLMEIMGNKFMWISLSMLRMGLHNPNPILVSLLSPSGALGSNLASAKN